MKSQLEFIEGQLERRPNLTSEKKLIRFTFQKEEDTPYEIKLFDSPENIKKLLDFLPSFQTGLVFIVENLNIHDSETDIYFDSNTKSIENFIENLINMNRKDWIPITEKAEFKRYYFPYSDDKFDILEYPHFISRIIVSPQLNGNYKYDGLLYFHQ